MKAKAQVVTALARRAALAKKLARNPFVMLAPPPKPKRAAGKGRRKTRPRKSRRRTK